MKIPRYILLVGGLFLVLAVINYDILAKQDTIANGRLVLLPLRPVDPRSLMQGDYMVLRYADSTFPPAEMIGNLSSRGTLVLRLDESNIGRFARMDDGTPLAPDEVRVRFKGMSGQMEPRLGAESFFFQEGDGEIYAHAKFGMLRVDPSGNSILIGLAGENRQQLVREPAAN